MGRLKIAQYEHLATHLKDRRRYMTHEIKHRNGKLYYIQKIAFDNNLFYDIIYEEFHYSVASDQQMIFVQDNCHNINIDCHKNFQNYDRSVRDINIHWLPTNNKEDDVFYFGDAFSDLHNTVAQIDANNNDALVRMKIFMVTSCVILLYIAFILEL